MTKTSIGRTFWRSYFRVYDRIAQALPYQQLLRAGVRRLNVKPGGQYLDLGCGTGNSTLMIAQKLTSGSFVMGIDNSKTAIELARTKAATIGFSRTSFSLCSINKDLEFNDQHFDGVLANNVIYLVKDPVQTLAEVLRVLKPGASFVMSNPKRGASPFKILVEHLRLKHEAYREQGASFSTFRTMIHGVVKFTDFLRLLPFQLLLKSGTTVEARFWAASEWQTIFDQLSQSSQIPFEASAPALDYADQNYTFTLTRLGE